MENRRIDTAIPEKCCGCAACIFVCPVGALSMKEGKLGFSYPLIDDEKCIDCGACIKACAFKKLLLTSA